MSETRNRNRNGFSRGRTHDLCKLISITRQQKLTDTGTIQLRMDVIDPNLSLAFRENARCEREKRRCAYKFAPREHWGRLIDPLRFRRGKLLRLWRWIHQPVRILCANHRDQKIG